MPKISDAQTSSAFNLSTCEAKLGGSLQVQVQLDLHCEFQDSQADNASNKQRNKIKQNKTKTTIEKIYNSGRDWLVHICTFYSCPNNKRKYTEPQHSKMFLSNKVFLRLLKNLIQSSNVTVQSNDSILRRTAGTTHRWDYLLWNKLSFLINILLICKRKLMEQKIIICMARQPRFNKCWILFSLMFLGRWFLSSWVSVYISKMEFKLYRGVKSCLGELVCI